MRRDNRRSSGLAREQAGADPEFREGLEILLVRACDGVFLTAFDLQAVFSRRKRPDFFYKRSIHKNRAVDADESVRFKPLCHHRNGLAQQVGTRVPSEPHVFPIGLN